jgi:hypothetical protein
MAAVMMPAARLAPALVARLGARVVCAAGLGLIAAALAVLAQLTGTSGYWLLAAGLIPLGVGMGLATTPATSGITSALPAAQQGVGSALNDLSREVGGAAGIAVLASVLTTTYQGHLHLAQLPAAQAAQARSSVAVAVHLGPAAAGQAGTAFTDGLHLALLIAAGIAAAAIAVAALLRGNGVQDNNGCRRGGVTMPAIPSAPRQPLVSPPGRSRQHSARADMPDQKAAGQHGIGPRTC